MSTKHTPGPWIAECVGTGGDHDNPRDVYEVTNGYRRIAEYLTEEDAKLCAAAPELLAALDAVCACHRTFRNVPEEDQQWTSFDEEALRAGFAAIARARGED